MSRESFKGDLQGWEIRLTLHSYHHHLRPPFKQKIQLDTRSYLDGTKYKKVSQRRAICLTFRVMVLIYLNIFNIAGPEEHGRLEVRVPQRNATF